MNQTTEAFSRVKIDALLKDAGWNLTDRVSVLFEHALPDGSRADYALCDRSGRPLAAVEAKRASIDPIAAQDQGRHYAEQLGVPFVFLSNGDEVRFLDRETEAHARTIEADGKTVRRGLGDALSRAALRQLQEATLFGNDVDPRMVRLATMNLSLRGLDRVRILRRDALTRSLDRPTKAELGLPVQGFDVVLANPPFSGRLDPDRMVEDVKIGRTRQTELLFLQYMLNHLKDGGRCGVVVPEGVLFGSTGAHRELRRKLVENNRVDAVLSLPGGVFNPYSGVKTSVLAFRKGGATERVMFLYADNDGFKLDANHDTPIDEDDLPGLVSAFRDREARWVAWTARDPETDWTENWWFAEADDIRAADFNLSAGRYRPQNQTTVDHRDPLEILDELKAIENEILGEIDDLAAAVREASIT